MHSMTIASASASAAARMIRNCSMMLERAGRNTGCSLPSGKIMRGSVPVVLAQVRIPPACNPAAIKRVTLDFPRAPLT